MLYVKFELVNTNNFESVLGLMQNVTLTLDLKRCLGLYPPNPKYLGLCSVLEQNHTLTLALKLRLCLEHHNPRYIGLCLVLLQNHTLTLASKPYLWVEHHNPRVILRVIFRVMG